jgi:DnaJ-class molecular chaperone
MGLFHYLSEWKSNLSEKRMAEAHSLGHCPECNGKGFQMPFATEYYMPEVYDCLDCNGTGTFAGWNENRQKKSR